MPASLTTPLRREIEIDGETYTVTISATGVRLVRKRFRAGRSLTWRALLEQGVPDTAGGRAGQAVTSARRRAEP